MQDRVQRLLNRVKAVIESNLDMLRSADRISLGEYSLIVSASIYCEDCDEQFTLTDLLERGRCDCDTDHEPGM